MKAIVIREFGNASQLKLDHVSPPEAGPGEVTIDVAYAGVGFVDTLLRAGKFAFAKLPLIPGIEVSGFVRTVGEGVTNLAPGQKVAALLTDFTVGGGGMGGYAEVARAKAALTIPLASEDDLVAAAAIIVNGATAVMAVGSLEPGARVAISGASGGLGQCLIAAAKAAGAAEIIAISSKVTHHETLIRAGATKAITADDVENLTDNLDAAFDTVGGEFRLGLLRHLKTRGRLVLLGNASGMDTPLPGDEIWLRSLQIEGFATGGLSSLFPDRVADAARAALSLDHRSMGEIAVLDLHKAGDAHTALQTRQGPGKFVLRVR
ncbi:quinone oxidoreductase family protein [Microvirga rosea]|uniref:quinone oxidoreductase family protein n=1 Tax=Microvirga rosea TaxID=2715425 RepID=UPI001D0BC5C8|nr:zinc-binding dehydrogenase [Microvirga rosea]MCB8822934.1 zinc-binding dehydrogenase [Microvirga rosea]